MIMSEYFFSSPILKTAGKPQLGGKYFLNKGGGGGGGGVTLLNSRIISLGTLH